MKNIEEVGVRCSVGGNSYHRGGNWGGKIKLM